MKSAAVALVLFWALVLGVVGVSAWARLHLLLA